MGRDDARYRSPQPHGREPDSLLTSFQQGARRVLGVLDAKTLEMRTKSRLVFYPNEGLRTTVKDLDGIEKELKEDLHTTFGHIYVIGGLGERYEAVGGPKKSNPNDKSQGGHTAEQTPAGRYVLGPKHHHTTKNWPMSVIPYGAALRLNRDNLVEFQDNDRKWKLANGPHGKWTQAMLLYRQRSGEKAVITPGDIAGFNHLAMEYTNKTRDFWMMNDFGLWAWNLRKAKSKEGTAYFVHTTADDEIIYDRHLLARLLVGQSHGCIHIYPKDRDEMILRGYLRAGVAFEVKSYDDKGPPMEWFRS